jgi:hypothetical protein
MKKNRHHNRVKRHQLTSIRAGYIYSLEMSHISSNSFLSFLSKVLRNGFHPAFSIARVMRKEGIVLPILNRVQGLHKWELALRGERERERRER